MNMGCLKPLKGTIAERRKTEGMNQFGAWKCHKETPYVAT
jgi:hypothetical protein